MSNNLSPGLVLEALTAWCGNPDPSAFPYNAVVAEYLGTGKHFVSSELLEALALARSVLPDPAGPSDNLLLREFLRSALDKRDGSYDYTTYLALGLLPMSSMDDPPDLVPSALQRRDRLVLQLVADVTSFELALADGRTDLLPEMPPTPNITAKRYRLAMRIAMPILQRLDLADRITTDNPDQAARELCAVVLPDLSVRDRRILQLSMLPVYVHHDEYLFIRGLQMYETTFALLATMLSAAVRALAEDNYATAVEYIDVAALTLHEAARVFSLIATMQRASFRIFRMYTSGASAIQSRNYKIVESLCRTPDAERLDSAAYLSVPEVRNWVLACHTTLDDAFRSASASRRLTAAQLEGLRAAMRRFAASLIAWRQTHYHVAVHMIGESTGTGYTEGPDYLKSVRAISVFRSIEHAEGGE